MHSGLFSNDALPIDPNLPREVLLEKLSELALKDLGSWENTKAIDEFGFRMLSQFQCVYHLLQVLFGALFGAWGQRLMF